MYYRIYNKQLLYTYKIFSLSELFSEARQIEIRNHIKEKGFHEDEIFKVTQINEPQS